MADLTEAEDAREQAQPFTKPDIEGIAELIRADGQLQDGEQKAQRAAADNAKLYTKIEKDLHGNKDAVKAVRRLIKAGRAHSDDFMRTFEPLAEHFELFPGTDLVDAAEGKGAAPPDTIDAAEEAARAAFDADDEDDDGDPDFSEVTEATANVAADVADEQEQPSVLPKPRGHSVKAKDAPFKSALDKSRAHLKERTPKTLSISTPDSSKAPAVH